MDSSKPEVVYLLGHPYTGSTLFALALGNSTGIVNLGEVSTLENDYDREKHCLCGKLLVNCGFWNRVKRELDEMQSDFRTDSQFQLSREGELSGPDKRNKSLLTRFKLILGVNHALSAENLDRYATKNEIFFNAVNQAMTAQFLVDASKSPHRLAILLERTSIHIKTIWLRRRLKSLFNSKIKRVKLRSRNYSPLFSGIFYLAWLLAQYWTSERVYNQIPNNDKCSIWYEDFIDNPIVVQAELTEFLNTNVSFEIDTDNCMKILDQHVYVGNRWLFEKPRIEKVQIRTERSSNSLGIVEETLYRVFSLMFPALRD